MANLFLPEDLKLNSPRNFHAGELHTAHTIAPDMMPLLQAEACNNDAGECATVGASLLSRMQSTRGGS
jgi:hypothetical protein